MNTLEVRREIAHVSFVRSLLDGRVSCPQILNKIIWNDARRLTRNYDKKIHIEKCDFKFFYLKLM